MKQVPEFSRAWLDARGGDTGMLATSKKTNRRNLFAETSKRLLDENRMQEFWVVTSVNQWLNRMRRAKTPTTTESILKFTPTGEEAA